MRTALTLLFLAAAGGLLLLRGSETPAQPVTSVIPEGTSTATIEPVRKYEAQKAYIRSLRTFPSPSPTSTVGN